MASRPVFAPAKNGTLSVRQEMVEFQWHPGMAKVQKQKSIASLHEAASNRGISPLLEISSKSTNELGFSLSAFNLQIVTKHKRRFPVECAFQASKVFERGGPFTDLLDRTPREAKKDIRLKESGNLIGFEFFGRKFPLKPRTLFYDWIYVNALNQNTNITDEVLKYSGFTDIEFNPAKSINCQAFSAALFVSLTYSSLLSDALTNPEDFASVVREVYQGHQSSKWIQGQLV